MVSGIISLARSHGLSGTDGVGPFRSSFDLDTKRIIDDLRAALEQFRLGATKLGDYSSVRAEQGTSP